MLELIVLIIFILSFGGVCFMLARKIPVLIQLPGVQEGVQKENIITALKNRIKSASPDKIILLKCLSKFRVLILKVEKYIDNWLQRMRRKVRLEKQEQEKEAEKKEEQKPPILPPSMPA